MAVYVDDMYKFPMGQFGRMKMSHMMADTTEELLAMADKIGVARKWIQHPGTVHEHFDISMGKRELAVRYGAKEITMRAMSMIAKSKRLDQQAAADPSIPRR